MLESQLGQPHETESLCTERGFGIEILVRGPIGQQVPVGLTRVEGRTPQLVDPCGRHGVGNLGIGAKRRGRDPHARNVLGAAGLVLEMAGGTKSSAAGMPDSRTDISASLKGRFVQEPNI
jgi:hypothetical protein